ncbi:hypothetical protein B4145_4562 [Bacillus subtilis]|uniref:Uncharacterized protein n=1 Tax=Bacillus subtilis subsp. subtilis TaxID=135461 RepID=A0ABD3ZZ81_BACIU|nr:hypothetical protein B4067_4645 [Bacillus subtilis subsp. subtilis]KIN59320.1 hypothetical protein B4145_4562 [Bacillus subtilis]
MTFGWFLEYSKKKLRFHPKKKEGNRISISFFLVLDDDDFW